MSEAWREGEEREDAGVSSFLPSTRKRSAASTAKKKKQSFSINNLALSLSLSPCVAPLSDAFDSRSSVETLVVSIEPN